MHLVSLHLRNFKRYRDQEVRFRDGITGILGNNGTGKSTIVDAVLFALYGVENTGLDKKHIVRASAGPRDRAEVRLEFSVRGGEYTVVRTLGSKSPHTAQLNQGPKLLAKGVTDVDAQIRGILQMGPGDFMHTIFSAQKDLAALLDATPGARKAWFRKVLGVDALKDRGGEMLRQEMAEAERHATLLEGRIQGADPEVLTRQREEADVAIAALETRVRSLEAEGSGLEERKTTLEKELRALQDRKEQALVLRNSIQAAVEERERLWREREQLQGEREAIESRGAGFQGLSVQEALYPAIRAQYEASSEKARKARELALKEEKETALREKAGKDLAQLQEDLEGLEQDERIIQQLAGAVTRREEVLTRRASLSQAEGQYHALGKRITRIEGELGMEAKRGAALRTRIEQMKAAQERLSGITGPWTTGEVREAGPDAILSSLDTRRKDLRDAVSGHRTHQGHAALRKTKGEEQLTGITTRGPEGPCPTCRQSLGDRFGDLVHDLQGEIRECDEILHSTAEALEKAERELADLEAVIGEARGLRDTCVRTAEAQAEWAAAQERSLGLLAEKEDLERQQENLEYTPGAMRALEEELEGLEDDWKRHLAASERVKRSPDVRKALGEREEEREGFLKQLEQIRREREELAFDPDAHRRLEEEVRSAEEAHTRFLAMKSEMDRIPLLQHQETDLAARADRAEKKMQGHRVKLEALAVSQDELNRADAAIRKNQAEQLQIAQALQAARSDREHRRRERERITADLATLEKDRAERDRLRGDVALLDLTRDQLNGFSDHLLGVVRDQVQGETGRILSEITDGRYDTVLIDDGFDLLVHDLGGDYPVSRFSGGEQDDVAIALRIALSRYIAGMHELHDSTFLIFDEIFGSQDEERRGNIFRALRTLEPHFPQIFLISHVAEVQGEFGNTLLVEAVSAGESTIRDLEAAEE